MEDTDLILLVQANEGLYNKKSLAFKSKLKKQQAWEEIARELGVDAHLCMKRWITLRERFSKELRINAEHGCDANKVQRWPLYDYMTFLQPHMLSRNKSYDSPFTHDASSTPTISKMNTDPIDPAQSSSIKLQKPWHVSELTSCSEQTSYQIPFRKRKANNSNNHNNHNNDDNKDDDAVEKAANAISELCKKRLRDTKNNELEKFGTMMIAMMECLPKTKQIRLMVSFMEQVANARLEDEGETLNTQQIDTVVEDEFQNI